MPEQQIRELCAVVGELPERDQVRVLDVCVALARRVAEMYHGWKARAAGDVGDCCCAEGNHKV